MYLNHKKTTAFRVNWTVGFGDYIMYECELGMFFENQELDPTQYQIEVGCMDTIGEYNTPVRQGDLWPNCTQTGEDGIIM